MQHKHTKKFTTYITLGALCASLGGCVTTQPQGDGSTKVTVSLADALGLPKGKPAPAVAPNTELKSNQPATKAAPVPPRAGSIQQTNLAGLFQKHPWNGSTRAVFPRVAVTLADWSRSDCWTAQATLWWSANKSEKISPFSVCWGTSLGFAVNNAANLHLFIGQSSMEHSGNIRSTGPKPPMIAIPDRAPLQESQQQNYHGFIQQLVLDTGWQAGAATNMWIVGFDANAAASPMATPAGPAPTTSAEQWTDAVVASAPCKSQLWKTVADAMNKKGNKIVRDKRDASENGEVSSGRVNLKTPLSAYGFSITQFFFVLDASGSDLESPLNAIPSAERNAALKTLVTTANLKQVAPNKFSRDTENGALLASIGKDGRIYIGCFGYHDY